MKGCYVAVGLIYSLLTLAWGEIDPADVNQARLAKEAYSEVKDKNAFLLKLSHSDNEVLLPWVIFHLEKIGDAHAIEALRRLTRHQQKETHDLSPVDGAARLSLERIESRVDLATLNGVLDAPARITLIRRLMQGENRVAQSGVRKFLMVKEQLSKKARAELLVEHFLYDTQVQQFLVDQGLPVSEAALSEALESPDMAQVRGAIRMIGRTRAKSLLPRVVHLIYADRNTASNTTLIIEVRVCLRAFGDEGLKALKPVLYSRTHLARMDAVQIISQAGNEAALELLTEFDASVENYPGWQDKNLKLRLKEGLQLLREELKQ